MVGAGQLARMTHQAGIALGQSLRLLADSPDDGAAIEMAAGDVAVFPKGWSGTWQIHDKVRKVYTLS